MAVLLQYNEQESLTVQQLLDNTGTYTAAIISILNKSDKIVSNFLYLQIPAINQESLIQVIQILLKSKLLTSTDDEASLKPTSNIELFMGYKK